MCKYAHRAARNMTSSSGEQESDSGGEAAGASGVVAKASLDEYTWDEISAISDEIAAASSETTDTLWLLSAVEVFSDIHWYGSGSVYDAILTGEGSQCQLFADVGMVQDSSNGFLAKTYLPTTDTSGTFKSGDPCFWWLRSAGPNYDDPFRRIDSIGYAMLSDAAGMYGGVAPGFCV